MKKHILRGEVYYADLNPVVGSEQGGVRPVLIIQNNTGNKHSPTVIVAAITSKGSKAPLPVHCAISNKDLLEHESIILLEQLRTIDKTRLVEHIGKIDEADMKCVELAIAVSTGIKRRCKNE